ncbi:MAG: hypothetical protein RBS80_04265 [Thermoguttaceae bacterium]|jgi:hypothetical protein|nr:hypothetical protein [Thermoguttaceae bacterium]
MSTSLLEQPAVQAATGFATSHAERLRATTMAMRLSFTWFGTRKTLSADQKDQAAESFGAEGSFLSAGKKLIDVKHPAFKAVSSVKNKAVRYFRKVSLPYPEAGIRLIRRNRLDEVNRQMEAFRGDLGDAVYHLDRAYAHLKILARNRLGTLYSEGDYPPSLRGLFGIADLAGRTRAGYPPRDPLRHDSGSRAIAAPYDDLEPSQAARNTDVRLGRECERHPCRLRLRREACSGSRRHILQGSQPWNHTGPWSSSGFGNRLVSSGLGLSPVPCPSCDREVDAPDAATLYCPYPARRRGDGLIVAAGVVVPLGKSLDLPRKPGQSPVNDYGRRPTFQELLP